MTIAKKHAQSYMPNGELSLEQVIQAAIDEAESLIIVGARERVRDIEWANDKLKDHAIALQERIRQLEQERAPEGYVLVKKSLLSETIERVNFSITGWESHVNALMDTLAAAPAQEKV